MRWNAILWLRVRDGVIWFRMDMNFITTKDQAERLSVRRTAVSIGIKRDRFDALGLGLGLSDCREAIIDLDGRSKTWRLVRVDFDPKNPMVINTGWVEV